MTRQVAIVGAGAAGVATATVLEEVADVTVFERREAVGGRSRSAERDGCRYELGANYLTPIDERVVSLVRDAVPAAQLCELEGTIYPFDGDGRIDDGSGTDGGDASDDGSGTDDEENGDDTDEADAHGGGMADAGEETVDGGEETADAAVETADDGERGPRLTCTGGLAGIVESVLAATDADVVLETHVDVLERTGDDWRVLDETGTDRGTFDAVVLTPPAPLAADLLGRSAWSHGDCRGVREAFESVPYRPITSVVLHYPFELDRSWYALVNDDRDHPLGWVAREDHKEGQVPDGETVLLVQTSSEFTIDRYGSDPAAIVEDVAILTAGLLADDRLADPDWTDFHCWRYAVPEGGVDPADLTCAADHDLYAAGDWVVGEDRLNGALRSGLATGDAVREDLI